MCENCIAPLKKVIPSFPATPSKSWGPAKPPLFGNLVGGSPPPAPAERGGVPTMYMDTDIWKIIKWTHLNISALFKTFERQIHDSNKNIPINTYLLSPLIQLGCFVKKKKINANGKGILNTALIVVIITYLLQDTFRTLSSIYHEAFKGSCAQLKSVNYFHKKLDLRCLEWSWFCRCCR